MSSSTRFISSMYSTYRMSRIISPNAEFLEHQSVSRSLGYRYRYLGNYNTRTRNFSVYNGVQPTAPLPTQPPSSSLRWLLGITLSIILPFAGSKWGPLLQFKNDVDTAVGTIEQIVDVVEKVAEVVDKVADGISGELPEGGKLKKVVEIVDDVAEKTAKDAHTVGDAIDKFQEVEGEVENIVETLSERQPK